MYEFLLTNKRQYRWDYHSEPRSYMLVEPMSDWLAEQGFTYRCETRRHRDEGGSTYLHHYILFESPREAIMFKLVWM